MESVRGEFIAKGFNAEFAKQFHDRRRLVPPGQHHSAKASRIMETQKTTGQHEIEMVMNAAWHGCLHEMKTSGHSQMNQQNPITCEINQKVFPPATNCFHPRTLQHPMALAKRPAQGLSQTDIQYDPADDSVRKTATGHLDFR